MQVECPDQIYGVVGLGEVGLPLSLRAAEAGFDVVGVDIDEDRVEQVQRGTSYIRDIDDQAVEAAVSEELTVSTSYDLLSDATHVAVCVPTPLQKSGQPDISYVADAVRELTDVLSPETTIIIESTVYPGATENLIADILRNAGFSVGTDVFLGFSPERIDPGNEEYTLREIPKVVGGVTTTCQARIESLYEQLFDEIVPVDSATEAEMTKILENTFRNVNIGLVNELTKVSHDLGINIWNVIAAADTKPYGFMTFYPGPGLGGHCIPVDPLYLSWRANQEGIDTPLVDLADETNRQMPKYVVQRLVNILNKEGIASADAEVLVVGVSYKPNIPDTRKSPAIDVIEILEQWGFSVTYHDPHVPTLTEDRIETYSSAPLTREQLSSADCTLLITDHDQVDTELLVEHSNLVFDTRNATEADSRPHVHRL